MPTAKLTGNKKKKRNPKDVVPKDDNYYSPTLSPNPDEVRDQETIPDSQHMDQINIGGTLNEDQAINEDSGAVTPGTPGHPGVDEGTD